jgi:DNA-binding NarL/FixJ family response regulator
VEKESIRILIVDDHPVVREGLTAMLTAESGLSVIGAVGTAEQALKTCRELQPDVIILDLLLPDMHGSHLISQIHENSWNMQIVVLTSTGGDEEIHRALEAGARGYLFKDMVRLELVNAIRAVHAGRRYIPETVGSRLAEGLPRTGLSAREIEVLKLVAVGKRNKEIAYDLSISEATVNAHLKHIAEKLNASDRTEAVTIALRRGFIHL